MFKDPARFSAKKIAVKNYYSAALTLDIHKKRAGGWLCGSLPMMSQEDDSAQGVERKPKARGLGVGRPS